MLGCRWRRLWSPLPAALMDRFVFPGAAYIHKQQVRSEQQRFQAADGCRVVLCCCVVVWELPAVGEQ